jgi:hypothetical protein
MNRLLEPRCRQDAPASFAARGSTEALARVHRLPPTRAARPARSRGVFFAASVYSRVGHWVINALCIAMVALSVVASAEFAGPAFDAAVVSGNVGPALVASAMRAPAFLAGRPH